MPPPNEGSGPQGCVTTPESRSTSTRQATTAPDEGIARFVTRDLPEPYSDAVTVRRWCAHSLARAESAGRIPLLGSPAWVALDDQDPRKLGSVIRAALAWLADSQPEVIAERLRAEMDFVDQITFQRLRDASHAVAAGADWSLVAYGPTHAELVRRRADPGQMHREWVARHGGEYRGGPIDIDTAGERPQNRKGAAA